MCSSISEGKKAKKVLLSALLIYQFSESLRGGGPVVGERSQICGVCARECVCVWGSICCFLYLTFCLLSQFWLVDGYAPLKV